MWYKNNMYKTKGFTLAEVLITLMVIGIIAALTIPALITNLQDAQLRTAWKSAYSDLDQTTKKIMLDNGGTMQGVIEQQSGTDNGSQFLNTYKPNLNYIKICASGDPLYGNCWSEGSKKLNGEIFDEFNFMDYGFFYGVLPEQYGLVLANGMFLAFSLSDSQCIYDGICGVIYVDVNGFNKPNIIGRDIFATYITKNGIKPIGYNTSYNNFKQCTIPSATGWDYASNVGLGCSQLYLQQ